MARVDYSVSAEAYRRARNLPPEVLDVWRAAVEALDLPRPRRVLDLGAGPGGFLAALVVWFDAPVFAVEPSEGMRDAARAAGLTASFPYVGAWAEAVPFAPDSFDLAWLSTVAHQFDDLAAAARELHRVVPRGGHVLVRGFFSDVAITGHLAAFPGIERSAAMFPSTDAVTGTFVRAGFTLEHIIDVVEPWRMDPAEYAERVRSIRSTDSALRHLTDAEVDEGLRVITSPRGSDPGLIVSEATLRLVVLGAT